jgi:hypothetical protein
MGTPMSGSMSGERKRSVAAWPKQPRLSPTLPRPTRLDVGSAQWLASTVTPLKLPAQIVVPDARWLGGRCTAASIAQTSQDATPAFSPYRSAVLGVYVAVVVGLARRIESHSTRNRLALAPPRYRFDLEISIAWSLARWAPENLPRDSSNDPRNGSSEFLWGAPRIHGELLKLGITVSQSQYRDICR